MEIIWRWWWNYKQGIYFVLVVLESDLDGHPKLPTDAKQQFTAI